MSGPVEKVAQFALRVINTPRRCAVAVIGLWVFCSLAYALIESKGPIEGLWWGIVTASTVGYGDYSPASTLGRFVGMLLIVGMWFLTLAAAALYTARAVQDRNAFTHEEQEEMLALARQTADDAAITRDAVLALLEAEAAHPNVLRGLAVFRKDMPKPIEPTPDATVTPGRAYAEGLTAGIRFEKHRWLRTSRNAAAMIAAGFDPDSDPVRPENPYPPS